MRSFRNDLCSSSAEPPKSQNMNPTMSSTAAGSRMTVYFPGGKSRGSFDSIAFMAATSAMRTGSRRALSGEFAFCHPDEELPIMLTETSARVCSYQAFTPFELKMPSTISAEEKMPAAARLCFFATSTMAATPWARSCGVSRAVASKYRLTAPSPQSADAAAATSSFVGIGNRSGSGCCTLASASDDCTTRRRLSSSCLLVLARAVRFPKAERTEMWYASSATF